MAATVVDLEGILPLERPLLVRHGDDTGTLLPAGTFVGLASTLSDDVLAVLVDGRELVGEAARVDVEAALTAPAPVNAAGRPGGPVLNLERRLATIVRNAERGAGYRRDLSDLVTDLRRANRTGLADRLLEAAGKPGTAYAGGAAHRLHLITLEES